MADADDLLLSLPFDHYQRYALTQRIVSVLWPSRQKGLLKILDVGGHASSLKHFQPEDVVILLDILAPPEFTHLQAIPFHHDGYVLGTGQKLPFATGSFDLVTTHDTLEHIPPAQRLDFLRELLRVARRFVIINGPVYHQETAAAEERLARFSQCAASWENPYLREHLEFGLPKREEIESVLREQGLPAITIPNGNLEQWMAMMAIRHYLMAFPHADGLREVIDRTYNTIFSPHDFGGLCYREAFVVAKNRGDLPTLRTVQIALASLLERPPGRSADKKLEALLAALEDHAEQVRREVNEQRGELLEKGRAIATLEGTIGRIQASLEEREQALRQVTQELMAIRQSLGYRLLEAYRRGVRWLFPPGSWRSVPYRAVVALLSASLSPQRPGMSRPRRLLRLASRSLQVIRNEGWRAFLQKARRRLTAGDGYDDQGTERELVRELKPLTFPDLSQVKVSIVIPVYNKSLYTYNCLLSILRNTEGGPYEVIVIDDASTDDTQSVLALVENVRVVRNAENLGFVASCNKGAALASGQYIVLLNNDTKVRKGWLKALMAAMEEDPRVGLVGAKLLYPNGKLQEAGSIVWSDGSGWNYGRHDDPGKPEYNYRRQVDYCSGACLLVRRDLFQQAGGFDSRYAPAYYEDTDLAFTIRSMGYKVIYQPQAEVVHFEGITAGRDTSQGVKRFQEVNRLKFVEKWQQVLAGEHLPNGKDLPMARDRCRGKRALVIDHHVPTPDRDSGSLRMHHLLRFLGELGFAITFLPHNLSRLEPYTQQLQQMGVEVLYGPLDVERFIQGRGRYLDLCIVARPDVATRYVPLLRRWAPRAKLLYDTVDLHFLREAEGGKAGK